MLSRYARALRQMASTIEADASSRDCLVAGLAFGNIKRQAEDALALIDKMRATVTAPVPKGGEWWICTTQEDVQHYGSAGAVPEDKRFMAFYRERAGEAEWCRVDDHEQHWRSHWVAALRKVGPS